MKPDLFQAPDYYLLDDLLTDEHKLVRDSARAWVKREVSPIIEDYAQRAEFPKQIIKGLGEIGGFGPYIPEEYGGAGLDQISYGLIMQEIERGDSGVRSTSSVQSSLVMYPIWKFGTEEQKMKYLPKLATGEFMGCFGLTEPDYGSNPSDLVTNYKDMGDHYLLNGSKTFISNGQHADVVVLAVKTDPQARAKGVSLLLVDTHLDGFKKGTNLDKIGLHSQDTSELFFDNVKVPKDQLLGNPGSGFAYLMQELPRERTAIASTALGAIRGAIDIATQYVKERQAFGQAIAQFQNTRFVLAQAKIDELATAAFYNQNVALYNEGKLDVETAAALKSFSTDMQMKVADNLLQLFGGYGYMTEYPISRFFVDARIQRIYGGTNEIMKEIVARGLIGKA